MERLVKDQKQEINIILKSFDYFENYDILVSELSTTGI
jgi:hypothetical protein